MICVFCLIIKINGCMKYKFIYLMNCLICNCEIIFDENLLLKKYNYWYVIKFIIVLFL